MNCENCKISERVRDLETFALTIGEKYIHGELVATDHDDFWDANEAIRQNHIHHSGHMVATPTARDRNGTELRVGDLIATTGRRRLFATIARIKSDNNIEIKWRTDGLAEFRYSDMFVLQERRAETEATNE